MARTFIARLLRAGTARKACLAVTVAILTQAWALGVASAQSFEAQYRKLPA
ncbi:MAG: hypothetical protein P8Y53_12275 [Pseudolabrys sp.]|jgi:hypothetical protein